MKKIVDFIEVYAVPLSLRMSSQRYFAAVRDGFNGMTELIMISSLAT